MNVQEAIDKLLYNSIIDRLRGYLCNDKMPNKRMYIVENKDITWEYNKDSSAW